MLNVISADDALSLLLKSFSGYERRSAAVSVDALLGRVLASDILAAEYVPDFDRSSVDGYAVISSDTFGCTEAIPSVLSLVGKVDMGESPAFALKAGQCAYVPTGGALPSGADAVVMIEYCEIYGDGTIGVLKPAAAGAGVVYRGDDTVPGKTLLRAGQRLSGKDIGALCAAGVTQVQAVLPPRVGVISTGDELIKPSDAPKRGQIRCVNGAMLCALVRQSGGEPIDLGIVRDDYETLKSVLLRGVEGCDMLLVSGGTSVGEKDAMPRLVSELGELLFHGLAVKPGKPTLAGRVCGKPVIGLPGHPVAAHFMYELLVKPLICDMLGADARPITVAAELSRAVPSNHGREELVPVSLKDGLAVPIAGKSGLITTLSQADGYIRIPRDCEGLAMGETASVILLGGSYGI